MLQLVVFIRKKRSNYGLGSINSPFYIGELIEQQAHKEALQLCKNMRRVFVMPLFFFNFAEF